MPAGKVIIDTNVYVTAIQQGRAGPDGSCRLIEWFPRTYLASVVSAELRAGVRSARGLREVLSFTHRVRSRGADGGADVRVLEPGGGHPGADRPDSS